MWRRPPLSAGSPRDETTTTAGPAPPEWSLLCPATAPPVIARSIAHLAANLLADEPQNVTRVLEAMRDEHMALAAGEALSGTGAHR